MLYQNGTPVAEIVRKMGIMEVTFYRWKENNAGLGGVAELHRLEQLEDKNPRLKRLAVGLTLDKQLHSSGCVSKKL